MSELERLFEEHASALATSVRGKAEFDGQRALRQVRTRRAVRSTAVAASVAAALVVVGGGSVAMVHALADDASASDGLPSATPSGAATSPSPTQATASQDQSTWSSPMTLSDRGTADNPIWVTAPTPYLEAFPGNPDAASDRAWWFIGARGDIDVVMSDPSLEILEGDPAEPNVYEVRDGVWYWIPKARGTQPLFDDLDQAATWQGVAYDDSITYEDLAALWADDFSRVWESTDRIAAIANRAREQAGDAPAHDFATVDASVEFTAGDPAADFTLAGTFAVGPAGIVFGKETTPPSLDKAQGTDFPATEATAFGACSQPWARTLTDISGSPNATHAVGDTFDTGGPVIVPDGDSTLGKALVTESAHNPESTELLRFTDAALLVVPQQVDGGTQAAAWAFALSETDTSGVYEVWQHAWTIDWARCS